MAEERDLRRVAGDPAGAFDDRGGALPDRPAQVTAAIMPVHREAQPVAGLGVGGARRPNGAAGDGDAERAALHVGEGLARREAELRV